VLKDPHRTNYGMNEPLNGAIRIFNEFSDLFEFGGSRDGFRVRIKEKMRQVLRKILLHMHIFNISILVDIFQFSFFIFHFVIFNFNKNSSLYSLACF
jgi:hypothetical protein